MEQNSQPKTLEFIAGDIILENDSILINSWNHIYRTWKASKEFYEKERKRDCVPDYSLYSFAVGSQILLKSRTGRYFSSMHVTDNGWYHACANGIWLEDVIHFFTMFIELFVRVDLKNYSTIKGVARLFAFPDYIPCYLDNAEIFEKYSEDLTKVLIENYLYDWAESDKKRLESGFNKENDLISIIIVQDLIAFSAMFELLINTEGVQRKKRAEILRIIIKYLSRWLEIDCDYLTRIMTLRVFKWLALIKVNLWENSYRSDYGDVFAPHSEEETPGTIAVRISQGSNGVNTYVLNDPEIMKDTYEFKTEDEWIIFSKGQEEPIRIERYDGFVINPFERYVELFHDDYSIKARRRYTFTETGGSYSFGKEYWDAHLLNFCGGVLNINDPIAYNKLLEFMLLVHDENNNLQKAVASNKLVKREEQVIDEQIEAYQKLQ